MSMKTKSTLSSRWHGLRLVSHARTLLAVSALAALAVPITAKSQVATQTLTILGGNGNAGAIASNVEYFNPVTQNWQPAYLAQFYNGPGFSQPISMHPWGNISGTNQWINYRVDGHSDPGAGVPNGTNSTLWYLYRVRFTVPSDAVNPKMTFSIKADNYAQVAINGVTTGGSTQYLNNTYMNNVIVGAADQLNADAVFAQAVHTGDNTITINAGDTGGLNGFNFRIDLSMQSSQPLVIVPPGTPTTTVSPPVISPVPADITVNATSAAGAVVNWSTPTASSAISSEIFRRKTVTAEPWKAYSVVFTPTISGNFKLRFRTVSDDGYDNTFFIDDVHVIANATNTELFHSGFELPTVTDAHYVSWLNTTTGSLLSNEPFGDWTFTNYSGVINGSPGSFGGSGPQEGSQRGFVQSFYGVLGNVTSASSFSLVAGQTYTVKFYQATRINFAGNLTYAVTLESTESDPVTFTPASGSTFTVGTTNVSLSATNSVGATTTGSFNVTVKGTPPVISASSPITVEATSSAGASVAAASLGTATDSYGASLPVTASPAGPYAIGINQVNLSATDAIGLTTTKQILVNVVDTTPPVIKLPDNITAEATSPTGATVAFSATALDSVSSGLPVTLTPASGSMFPLGTTTVNGTATDAAGNVATASFTVTVRDTTPPVISVTTGADFSENFSGYTPGAGATNTQFQSGLTVGYLGNIPGWTNVGVHAVHAVDLDGHGNWAVMIWQDNVITSTHTTADNASGADYVVHFNAGPAVDQITSQLTSPTDGLLIQILRADNTVLSQFTYHPGAWTGAPALVPVSFHYTGDGSGLLHLSVGPSAPNSNRFGGTIDDISITPSTPADITLEATSPAGAVATFGAAAHDLVSGAVSVTASSASGSTFPIGTTPVTLTAIDGAGNSATATFNVIVKDTTPPALTVPNNVVAEATSAAGAAVTFAATATDAVTTSPTITYAVNGVATTSGSTFPLGTTTVTVTAKDAAGNTSTGSFTVTVRDTKPPVITAPANIVTEATSAAGAVVTFTATANDLVDGTVAVSASPGSGSTFALGTTTVTLTATDAHGNTATSSFTITVNKVTAPITLSNLSTTYDSTVQSAGATTTPAGLTVVFNYVGTPLNTGSYNFTASIDDPIYTGSTNGTLVISQAASFTKTVGAGPFTYSSSAQVGGSGTVIGAGGLSTSATSLTYSANADGTGTADQTNAGTYYVTAHYSGDANHTASDGSAVAIKINQAASTTTTGGAGPFTYDGTTHAGGSGTVAGINLSTSATSLTYSANADGTGTADQTNAGTYYVTAHYSGDANHTASDGLPVAITIIKATSATTTVGAAPFTYDDTTHAGGSGTVTGINLSTSATSLTYLGDQIDAGSYTVTAHYSGDTNHTPSDGLSVTITINQATATVVPAPYTVTYDGSPHTAGFAITGVNNETGATVGNVTQNTTHTDVGIYSDTWSFTGTRNYSNIAATAIKDTITGTATASLVPVRSGGDDESTQSFTVAFSATDPAGVKTLVANLNGVAVTNGQIVQLQVIKSSAQRIERDDGRLHISATSFTLTAVATYTYGGTATATAVPVFKKSGQDSDTSKSANSNDSSSSDKKGGG